MDLEQFFLVVLRRAEVQPDLADDEIDRLQQAHLDYLLGLREQGVLALNGPLRDQPDANVRGLSFYRTETADEARRYAEADPMVRGGWLTFDLMTFLTRPGDLVRPGHVITID